MCKLLIAMLLIPTLAFGATSMALASSLFYVEGKPHDWDSSTGVTGTSQNFEGKPEDWGSPSRTAYRSNGKPDDWGFAKIFLTFGKPEDWDRPFVSFLSFLSRVRSSVSFFE